MEVTDFFGAPQEGRRYHVDWDLSAAEKEGHDWFMRKEIFEQPRAVADSLLGRRTASGLLQLDEMRLSDQELRDIDKIIIIACGTSFYAGMVAKYAIEHWTRVPVEVELSSEFRYRDPILDYSTLVVAISQSGETADTLQAIRHARTQRSKVLAICNTNGSTIPRESDAVIYTHAGPEIGVASTKGFLTQLVACYLLALYLAQVKGTRFGDEIGQVMSQLEAIPSQLETVLESAEPVYELARSLVGTQSVLFVGRHAGYPVALEGALKLKELAYLHAEGFAAGELKHGPIALIEDGMPVLCVVPPRGRDQLHDKMLSGIQEVRARGARTICLAEEGDERIVPYADVLIRLPPVPVLLQPLVAVVPLQLFACELATVDGPRRRPAPQPRQVRHRRVAPERTWRSSASASTWSTSSGSGSRSTARPASPSASSRPSSATRPLASLAARFAAKEAVAKALGAPGDMHWHDAEVVSEDSGRPVLELRGTVLARANDLGATSVHLSLSHDAGIASAVVVLEG